MIQEGLTNAWVVLTLALVMVLFGWLISGWIAKGFTALLNRTRLMSALGERLKLSNSDGILTVLQRLVRLALFALVLWFAWLTLHGHADISTFIFSAWAAIQTFAALPVVLFIFDLGLIAFATFILIKAFGWTKTGFAGIANRINSEKGTRLKGFKIQKVQIFTASQLTQFLLTVNQYSRYAVNTLLILLYLTGVFSVFPETRGVVTGILDSVVKSLESGWSNFVSYLPSLLNLILIIVVTYYSLKIVAFIFGELEKGTIKVDGFHADWATPTYQLVRVLVIALSLVVAFPYLPGSSSPAFQGVSVFIGVLFSLGSSSVVANIVSGIVLTYTRAFRIGDRVKIGDTVGDVIEKSLLVTRIRTIKNIEITIPNGIVLGNHIINYSAVSQEHGLILNTTITLGYDVPWRLVHETLIKAAQVTNGILAEPRPFVLQTSLDDFYVSYELNAYTNLPNKMAGVYSELHQNIQDHCNEAGIEILSPHYSALRDGNQNTIPSDYLPKNYQAPAFQVKVNKEK